MEDYAEEKSLRAFYEEVAIPALRLAENDRQRNPDNFTDRRTVADSLIAVVQEFAQESDEGAPDSRDRCPVLCIGGRTELDQTAAETLAQALGEAGIAARALPPLSLNREAINQIDLDDVAAVCLCYLDAQPHSYAKYAGRRLKRRAPGLKIITWFLNVSAGSAAPDARAKKTSDDIPAYALDDAVTRSLASSSVRRRARVRSRPFRLTRRNASRRCATCSFRPAAPASSMSSPRVWPRRSTCRSPSSR